MRLTSLAHGGGCGCKLSPLILRQLLSALPQTQLFPNLLVGAETADDAAVYRLSDDLALVATTDFFMPIVDDAYEFGRIAATNALSDIYAMGGTPVLALAVLGMPLGKLAIETVQDILRGGAEVCRAAGISVAGGHSIDSAEPIYGLAVFGTVHPDRILRNSGAQTDDVLILTKGLGVGIFSAALKRDQLSPDHYQTMLHSMTQLNAVGREVAEIEGVHAMTDVTGFGLLGHTLEMCRGAGRGAYIEMPAVPVLDGAEALARSGCVTGASGRNWASYGHDVHLPAGLADAGLANWQRDLLCDPQTSGGLLIAAAPTARGGLMRHLHAAGFGRAAVIGTVVEGRPEVTVVA